MGCVLSIDPKVDEVLKAIGKDTVPSKISTSMSSSKIAFTEHKVDAEECDDFEEGYSDDEMFSAEPAVDSGDDSEEGHHFRSWILDICCKNMGWVVRGKDTVVSYILFALKMIIFVLLCLIVVNSLKSVCLKLFRHHLCAILRCYFFFFMKRQSYSVCPYQTPISAPSKGYLKEIALCDKTINLWYTIKHK